MIEVACYLFFEYGYVGMIVVVVGCWVDVLELMIYWLFIFKVGIFKVLFDVFIVGDDEFVVVFWCFVVASFVWEVDF